MQSQSHPASLPCARRWPDGFADMIAAAVSGGETTEVDDGRLLGLLPGGVHFRPYGNASLLCLWEYFHAHRRPSDPPEPEIEFESGECGEISV